MSSGEEGDSGSGCVMKTMGGGHTIVLDDRIRKVPW